MAFQPVSIASSDSVSSAFRVQDHEVLVAIHLPAALDGSSLTFLTTYDFNGTYQDVRDASDTELEIPFTAGKTISIQPTEDCLDLQFLKIRTGTSASPSTQSAPRTIQVETRHRH